MGSWQFVTVLAAVSAHLAAGEVVELTDEDFVSKVENFETALVMFYAPWCGHCKKMKPEFEQASKVLARNDPPVDFAKIDCTEVGKATCGRFSVSGYPTLKIFRSGEKNPIDYNGPREAAGIAKFMKSQVGAASKELTSDDAFQKLVANTPEVLVVGNLENKDEMAAFEKTSKSLREKAAFAHSTATSKVRRPGIHLYRPKHLRTKMEPEVVTFSGDATVSADITAWVHDNYHGLVGHRTPDNSAEFPSPDRAVLTAYYDVDYERNPKGTNYWRNRIMKVAKGYKGYNSMVFSVSKSGDFQQEMEGYGLKPDSDDRPMVVIRDKDGQKFVMQEDFGVEALETFVMAFDEGALDPYMKSEPEPESNDGPVKVAVALNFDEVVTDSGKDALVEFYAPWCGHCKSLAPVYEQLGEKMKGEKVQIVKMDATANDVPPGFEVRGFPTIVWVKKGSKSPVPYGGGRELKDFIKYIANEATDELKGYDRSGKPKKKTEL